MQQRGCEATCRRAGLVLTNLKCMFMVLNILLKSKINIS